MQDIIAVRGLVPEPQVPSPQLSSVMAIEGLHVHVIAPDYGKDDLQDVYQRIIDTAKVCNDPVLIGHTFGAFMVRLVARPNNYRSILINPVMTPTKVPRYKGLGVTRYLERIAYDNRTAGSRGHQGEIVLVELGDEVINHIAQLQTGVFDHSDVRKFSGGEHKFIRTEQVHIAIDDILNLG